MDDEWKDQRDLLLSYTPRQHLLIASTILNLPPLLETELTHEISIKGNADSVLTHLSAQTHLMFSVVKMLDDFTRKQNQ